MGNQIPNLVNSHTPHAFTSAHPLRLIKGKLSLKTLRHLNNFDILVGRHLNSLKKCHTNDKACMHRKDTGLRIIGGDLKGKKQLEVTDKTFAGPGGIGVWTKADAVTLFDDLVIDARN